MVKSDIKKLGDIIREKRKLMKLSLRDAADGIGISHSYLSTLEKGLDPRSDMPILPTLETIKLLGNYFDIPIQMLLELSGYDLSFMDTSKITANLKIEYLKIAEELQQNNISIDDIKDLITIVNRNRRYN